LALPSSAASYYVSTGGNDSADGSLAHPWATLGRAVTTPGPGDTLFIRGTYQTQLILRRSGSPGAYITYTKWPGDSATLDGAGSGLTYNRANRFGMVQLDHVSWVRVRGLRIINSPFFGVGMRVTSHVIIERNYLNNTTYSGIITWEESDSADPSAKGGHDNILIDSNEVVLACNDGPQECISLWGTDTFEVRYNHVHHGGPGSQGGEGIDVKCGSSHGSIHHNLVDHMNRQGIYVDAGASLTSDIDIYANVVHDCPTQDGFDIGSESGGTLQGVRIYNNVAWNNGCNGLRFASWGSTVGPMRDITVVNNTFVGNGSGTWGNRGGISVEASDVSNVILRNNILSDNVQFQVYVIPAAAADVTVDHNLIDGYRAATGEVRGTDSVEGDPAFEAPLTGGFALLGTSSAINKGSSDLAPAVDMDSVARPQGAAFDIGAYEYVATAVAVATVTPRTVAARGRFVPGVHGVRVTGTGTRGMHDLQGRAVRAQSAAGRN